MRLNYRRLIAGIMSLILVASVLSVSATESATEKGDLGLVGVENFNKYKASVNKEIITGNEIIELNVSNFISNDSGFEYKTLSESTKALYTPSTGSASFSFNASKSGWYRIKAGYYSIEGSGMAAVRKILVDGELPYSEASSATFPRLWKNSTDDFQKDTNGNEILPNQVEIFREEIIYLSNTNNDTNDNLYFYITAGHHTLTLTSQKEPLAITYLALEEMKDIKPYNKIAEEYKKKNYKVNSKIEKIEAEKASAKSDSTIYPLRDKSSSLTSPSSDTYTRYNTIGGNKWGSSGQWIEWNFTVEESGLYTIALRFRQNQKFNSTVYRRLYIDGDIPFEEANCITFPYTSDFSAKVLGDEKNGDYKFYFKAGEIHSIRFEVINGEFAGIIAEARDYVNELNQIYRELLMITGPSPDLYRDYEFPAMIPDTLEKMRKVRKALGELTEKVKGIVGSDSGFQLSSLEQINQTLDKMIDDDTTISARFSNFQNNISSLASWVYDLKTQPLEFDYLLVGGTEKNIKIKVNFFKNIIYHVKQFLGTFITDYNSVGQLDTKTDKQITVWIQSGRDQSTVIKNLINQDFTPNHNMSVRLQLVAVGSLLPAIIAGMGPDAALQLPQGDPLNYAFREAVADLSGFADINEITHRFSATTMDPFSYNGHLYALPESQSFQMLFYRKDILSDLGISSSDISTWDNIMHIVVPELQKNYLDFGIMPSFNNFAMRLYQAGGDIYDDQGTKSLLNSEVSISVFDNFTKLYTEYLQPVSFDFANRFRTGQMPLAVVDFSSYNQLSVFAPEIQGLWDMKPVPATVREDGTLDNTAALTLSSCVIFEYSKHKEEAWEFLKWWTSAEAQIAYGKNIESIMGTAARYNSANLEAFKSVAWDTNIRNSIDEQLNHVKAIREVPGGYYTTRYFDFAYRDVVNNGIEVRDSLNSSVKQINDEITGKRKEFGFE